MSRKKMEKVRELDKAEVRVKALESIDPALDLGNGLTLALYQKALQDARTKVGTYNTTLSAIDGMYNDAVESVHLLSDLSVRMLSGVLSKFGSNSNEYEMAGGTKKSERKKPTRKVAKP